MESDHPLDPWTYRESLLARTMRTLWPDKQLSNAADHFPWLTHRLSSVSPDLTRKRIFQCMVSGAWLDFYCIGPFHTQEDRLAVGEVTRLFRFHADNEPWLLDTVDDPDVGLFCGYFSSDEHRGLVAALSADHVTYGVVSPDDPDLDRYPALVYSLEEEPAEALVRRLDRYVEAGGRLLLTGGPPPDGLTCLGVGNTPRKIERAAGTYVRVRPEDHRRLASAVLEQLDLLFLDGDFWQADMDPSAEGLLRFIPAAMFGPPEKCYYTEVSDIPCLFVRRHGAGRVAWIPWAVGTHFHRQGHAGHAALVLAVLDHLLEPPRRVRVKAAAMVEVTHRMDRGGRFEWISLYNHSGQMDRVQGAPVPLLEVEVHLRPHRPPRRVHLLGSRREIGFTAATDGMVSLVVPRLDEYEIVVVE
jgi:hypothetical protein